MRSAVLLLNPADPKDTVRDALVRVLGWRALFLQQDPPTYDRWRWVKRHLRPGPLRTLDAGSGSGAFTMYAAARGNEALGISFDERANHRASRRARLLGFRHAHFRTGDLRQLKSYSPELGAFDQILCLETIEHVMADQALVNDLAALLRPGGTLLLSTPYAAHRPLRGERLSAVEDGGHVRWGYTFGELRSMLTAAGLRVQSEEFLSGFVSQQITNAARAVEDRIGAHAAWALTAPLRVLQTVDRWLSSRIGYPPLAVAVVGVRP